MPNASDDLNCTKVKARETKLVPYEKAKDTAPPYISTLKRKDIPTDADMIRWTPYHHGRSGRTNSLAARRVMLNGKDIGQVRIPFALSPLLKEDEEIWLRPYFDPTARCLRLQRRDGSDYSYIRDVHTLAAHTYLRPILHLAHAEGLLESVPGKHQSFSTNNNRNPHIRSHLQIAG
ncbi:hypothetical protein FRB95_006042 [Tulasnella sp. JGI-2019a]|nr:hypothetical protein FRB95_006042 [Tulasnella sp. JGI-2019a]